MAESFHDLLDRSKRSAVAIFHRFRLEVASGLQRAVFVEGFEDKAFYCRFLPIGKFSQDDVRISFGKRNMDRIVSMYYANGIDNRCDARFIRDADFDDFLGSIPSGDCVFTLNRYSVENYIFTTDNLKRFILERFGVAPEEYDVESCVQRYENSVHSIFQHLAPLIGASLFALRMGHSLNLNGLDIRGLAADFFSTGTIRDLQNLDYTRCSIPLDCRCEESLALGVGFVKRDSFLWLRGHYLANLSSVFIQKTHDDICLRKASGELHTLNPNIGMDFSPPSLAERISAYCTTPDALNNLAT